MKFHQFFVRTISSLALVSLVSVAAVTGAQAAAATAQIVVVNTQELFSKSKVGTSLRTQLETLGKQLENDGKKGEADLQAEAKKLGEQRSLLSEADLQKRVQALQQKQTNLQNRLQKRSQDIQTASAKARTQIETAVGPIFADVMKKHGANMMLDRSAVLANDPAIDVTNEVLTALDAKITTVAVKP